MRRLLVAPELSRRSTLRVAGTHCTYICLRLCRPVIGNTSTTPFKPAMICVWAVQGLSFFSRGHPILKCRTINREGPKRPSFTELPMYMCIPYPKCLCLHTCRVYTWPPKYYTGNPLLRPKYIRCRYIDPLESPKP